MQQDPWTLEIKPKPEQPTEVLGIMHVHVHGVTTHEIAHAAIRWAAALLHNPASVLPTAAELLERRRELDIARDYPAIRWGHGPNGPVFLCPACTDVYDDAPEPIPATFARPIPCTYHLHPERAPEAYEAAAARKNAAEWAEE